MRNGCRSFTFALDFLFAFKGGLRNPVQIKHSTGPAQGGGGVLSYESCSVIKPNPMIKPNPKTADLKNANLKMSRLLARQPEIRMVSIPRLAKGGRWRVEAMRSYASDVLIWFTRGQGRITVAGVTRGYGPHNLIFVPAGTMHGFEAGPQVFGTVLFFPRESTLPLPEKPLHLRIRDAQPQGEATALLEAMQRESEGHRPERMRAVHHYAGLLTVWLSRQLQNEDAQSPTPPDRNRVLAMRFSDMIERNFHSARSVADYARDLGVSPTHLSRACNRACGRPASALLSDRVLYEARRMLSETHLSVRAVAQSLGYSSAAYFSRAFQRHTGQTPSAFRRQN